MGLMRILGSPPDLALKRQALRLRPSGPGSTRGQACSDKVELRSSLSLAPHRFSLPSLDPQRETPHRDRRTGRGEPVEVQPVGAGGERRRVDGDEKSAEVVEHQAGGLEDDGSPIVRERRPIGRILGIARLHPESDPALPGGKLEGTYRPATAYRCQGENRKVCLGLAVRRHLPGEGFAFLRLSREVGLSLLELLLNRRQAIRGALL